MSTTTAVHPAAVRFAQWDVWRCLSCRSPLVPKGDQPALVCGGCGATARIDDDILIMSEQTASNNQIAQSFYDGPLWPKFRFWEHFTWFCNGGEKRARGKVLRHLPTAPGLELLDVAIGDGAYLEWLPADWKIAGVDISRSQLDRCRRRALSRDVAPAQYEGDPENPYKPTELSSAGRDVWLAQCEAERLPFDDQRFDAVLSIGAFNYFSDPEGALREMARVARPGAPIVVSDEIPNLTDRMIGRKLGLPGLDRFIVSKLMHLGDPFTDMVERCRDLDVLNLARRVLPDCRIEPVWWGVGYVLVGRAPSR